MLSEHAKNQYANFKAQNEVIADKENDRYQLVTMGWEGHKRVHACTIHLDIIDNKIWIQNDETERGIVYELMEAGVPNTDLVIGYFTPQMREDSGFAVA